ncbi:hypothetical protein DSECCO2_363750 [anaerobic digester metagenome]
MRAGGPLPGAARPQEEPGRHNQGDRGRPGEPDPAAGNGVRRPGPGRGTPGAERLRQGGALPPRTSRHGRLQDDRAVRLAQRGQGAEFQVALGPGGRRGPPGSDGGDGAQAVPDELGLPRCDPSVVRGPGHRVERPAAGEGPGGAVLGHRNPPEAVCGGAGANLRPGPHRRGVASRPPEAQAALPGHGRAAYGAPGVAGRGPGLPGGDDRPRADSLSGPDDQGEGAARHGLPGHLGPGRQDLPLPLRGAVCRYASRPERGFPPGHEDPAGHIRPSAQL